MEQISAPAGSVDIVPGGGNSVDTTLPAPPIEEHSVDTGAQVNPPPLPDTAETRASRMKFGIGQYTNKSDREIYDMLMQGREDDMRKEAADGVQKSKEKALFDILTSTSKDMGRGLTPRENDYIKEAFKRVQDGTDPNTVTEQLTAENFMSELDKSDSRMADTLWGDAAKEIPDNLMNAKKIGNEFISKIEYARNQLQNMQDALEQQSTTGFIADQLKQMVPFYTDVKMRGQNPNVGTLSGGLGLGPNITEQTRDLLRLPFKEFASKYQEILTKLKNDNPSLAYEFAKSVVGQSQSEENINSQFTMIDATILPTIAKLGRGVLRKINLKNHVDQATKDIIKAATEDGKITKAGVAEAAGDLEEAGVQKVTSRLLEDFNKSDVKPDVQVRALESIHSVFRAEVNKFRENTGNLSREVAARIEQRIQEADSVLEATIQHVNRVIRVPELATEQGVRAVNDLVKARLTGKSSDALLDIGVPYREPVSGTMWVDVALGTTKANLFKGKMTAQSVASQHYGLKIPASDVKLDQKGNGYYIKYSIPINETDPVVKSILNHTTQTEGVSAKLNSVIGAFRTPEETMSDMARANRKTAVYTPSVLAKMAEETAREIKDLARGIVRFDPITNEPIGFMRRTAKALAGSFPVIGKNARRWDDFELVLKSLRTMDNPTTGKKGVFFEHAGQMEDFYMTHIHRMPEPIEVEAYFAYKRLLEYDYQFRDLSLFKYKARLGAESHTFFSIGKDGLRVEAPAFDGMVLRELPTGDYKMLIVGDKVGKEIIMTPDELRIKKKYWDKLQQGVKSGAYKVIEVYDPETRPFTGFGKVEDQSIRYVVTSNAQSKPIAFGQLSRLEGGHFDYDYDFYIKQAKIRPERYGKSVRHTYEGDTTVMPIAYRKLGQKNLEDLEIVRKFLDANNPAAARAHTEATLPVEWKELHSWFLPKKVDGVIQPPRLSTKEPFQIVPHGKQIVDMGHDLSNRYRNAQGDTTFRDGTKSGSAARQYKVEYAAERDSYDLHTINDVGTKRNPLLKWEPAKMIDPIPSMDRALQRIMNSAFIDDYKIYSVEHWLNQAKNILKADPSEVMHSPFYYFQNPEFKNGVDTTLKNQLEATHYQIRQMLGIPSKLDERLHSIAQSAADVVYDKLGPRLAPLDPSWMIAQIKDPFAFVRAMTFHLKLGLFSIPQFLVQSQTYSTIFGVAGFKMAAPGTKAAMLHMWSRVNPAHLDHLDQLATHQLIPGTERWRPGWFKEAWTEGQNSGFFTVAGEHSFNPDLHHNPKIVKYGSREVLDAGTFFFREGEKNVRAGAWYTAFLEFRSKNPTGKLTEIDKKAILDRADLLSVNMSRASASLLHTGPMAFTSQFLSYQIRSMELMTGNRLTALQKGRVLAWYAGLYGFPVATSSIGFPIGDYVRRAAYDNGYIPGENTLSTTFFEGVPAAVTALITGGGDIQKGNVYNIGDRMGTQGFEFIREALRGDLKWWAVLGGASGSVVQGILEGLDPYTKAMMSQMSDNPRQTPITPTIDNIIDIAKESSSFNSGWRLGIALNTGRWFSKKEAFLDDDVSKMNALFMTLTGVQDINASDLHLMKWDKDVDRDMQKEGLNRFIKEYRRSLVARFDGDTTNGDIYMRNAFGYLEVMGYPREKIGAAIAMANRGYETMVDQTMETFYTKDIFEGEKDTRTEAYRRRLQLKDIKRGK